MSNKKETIFPDGFILKRNANAPEWVVGNLSIKVDEAIKFLTDHQKKGWVINQHRRLDEDMRHRFHSD